MFSINYTKNDTSQLKETLSEKTEIHNIQNYIPLYKRFFTFSKNNFNNFNLNNKLHLKMINEKFNTNIYNCNLIDNSSNITDKFSFFKFSPLIDPIKYMAGKYDFSDINILPNYNETNDLNIDKKIYEKLNDCNNSAYIDSFFSYLSSQLLNNYGFIHGIDFYGSFLGNKKDYQLNIYDDVDYLNDNDFFYKNNDILFKIEDIKSVSMINNHTRNYKKKIDIKKSIKITDLCEDLNEDLFDNLFTENNGELNDETLQLTIENVNKLNLENNDTIYENKKLLKKKSESSTSCCSSRTSNTEESGEEESGQEESGEEESGEEESGEEESEDERSETESLLSEPELLATINNFPVQLIALELLDCTLDKLIEIDEDDFLTINLPNKKSIRVNALENKELLSCLFQVIMTLITYQKVFDFTHNDLHTNNIMFKLTDKQYIYYKYNNTYYKVPTYGKIYKIIDFGRSIYKYKNHTFCSDSYKNKGDAAGQYNFGPYFNKNKPELKPNKSFDLCRLGTCLYDFFVIDIDDEELLECDEEDFTQEDKDVSKLINDWCLDTKGRNIGYKKNGEERYNDFKLYKMIARTVNNKEPHKQLSNPLFERYKISRKKLKKKHKIINIDAMPKLYD